MSIFEHQDLDNVLLCYLNIKDIVVLSHVSKYYRQITESKVAQLREFFRIRHALLPKVLNYKRITISHHKNIQLQGVAHNSEELTILDQALIYGNADVLAYVNPHFVRKSLYNIEFKDEDERVFALTFVDIGELCALLDINDDNCVRMEYVSKSLNLPDIFKAITTTRTYSITKIKRYCKNNSNKIISYLKN